MGSPRGFWGWIVGGKMMGCSFPSFRPREVEMEDVLFLPRDFLGKEDLGDRGGRGRKRRQREGMG